MQELKFTTMISGPLTRNYRAYYSEISIQNYTPDVIYLIDAQNNKTPIEPVTSYPLGERTITIIRRKTTEPTIEGYSPKAFESDVLKIPYHSLRETHSIYIKEFNFVLCTEDVAMQVSHPTIAASYDAVAYSLREELASTVSDAPTIKILANDPKNRYTKLYTAVGNMLIPIDVTNLPGDAELKIIFMHNGSSDDHVVPLDTFFESDEDVLEIKDCPISFISVNKAIAKRSAADFKRVSQTEVTALLKRQKEQLQHEHDSEREQMDAQLKTKDVQLKTSTAECASLKNELATLKNEYDAYVANMNSVAKIKELSVKQDKADSDRDTERLKTIGIYGSLGVAALGLIVKCIDMYIKSKK